MAYISLVILHQTAQSKLTNKPCIWYVAGTTYTCKDTITEVALLCACGKH